MTAPDFGSILPQAYAVERELTGGGMARVFLARDEKLGRRIVVKLLTPELSATLSVDRFRREIALAARLRHPNIVPLLDAGASGGALYYTMPYIAGESLRERLRRDGPLPLTEAMRLTREIADALSYAHGEGVVHRDIKPENVLLDSGHAVVTDFGIARAVSQSGTQALTMTGVAVGTPAYMSPEQFTPNADVDARSDIYSLGCVLFEMLTGKTLLSVGRFGSSTLDGILASIKAVISKAVAENRAERFDSAEAFSEALELAARTGASSFPARTTWKVAVLAALTVLAAAVVWQLRPSRASVRRVTQGQPLLTGTFNSVPLRDIVRELAPLVERTFDVSRAAETTRITARVVDQRWDVSLMAMLKAKGLEGLEDENGTITIRTAAEVAALAALEPDATRAVYLCWRRARVVAEMIRPRVGPSGAVSVDSQLNQIVITTKGAVMEDLIHFVQQLDQSSPKTKAIGRSPNCTAGGR